MIVQPINEWEKLMIESILLWGFAVLTAPLFAGVIFKVKAFFGGRKGSPVLINYYTLIKLFKKGSVYSTSTTYIFRLGPMVSLGSASHGAAFSAHRRPCPGPLV
jgi:formate hydrogenlyase subunit 4